MLKLRYALVGLALLTLATSAFAQVPAKPAEVAVAPIECWWKTDRSAVRVGERFNLTLTCAVLDTDKVRVVVDESSLAPSALHLVPFEIVDGQRFRDILNAPRRFFQYQYAMRVLGEEFFGKEITLPRLQLSYRVQNSLNGSSSLAGREEQYSLRPVPMRILSLVPAGTIEIRDAPPDTFGDVDTRLFRSNLLLMVAAVALVLAGLVAILLLARAAVKRRASAMVKQRVVPAGAVLRAASGELARVRKASESDGWNSDLAGRAASALRLAGAVALNRSVSQREVGRGTTLGEGQLMIRRGLRGRRLAVSAGITPGTISVNGAAPVGSRARTLWDGISQPLGIFTTVRYSRKGTIDGTSLDHALAEGQDAVKRLRVYQWQRIGRGRGLTRRTPGEGGHIQTWAR
ncbi:MAG: hypothetical protein ND807_09005 [Vicinamibacterales bacterium]|nr:hypothetical protein [Vicinamibacterales bacterium]